MKLYYILVVATMALFTYLPRVLPITLFRKTITSQFIKDILYYVPYAVLGALTFPGVFMATGNTIQSCIATVVALFFAYQKKGLVTVAVAAIIAAYVSGVAMGL